MEVNGTQLQQNYAGGQFSCIIHGGQGRRQMFLFDLNQIEHLWQSLW